MRSSFFSQGKFNSFKLYFSTLYPYFIHPLHTIIKRNITYIQNYTKNVKNASQFLKKHFRLQRGKSLGVFITKWISNENLNAGSKWTVLLSSLVVTLVWMPIGFGATKCIWMVPQRACKIFQYIIAFDCSFSSFDTSLKWIHVCCKTISSSDLASLTTALQYMIAPIANFLWCLQDHSQTPFHDL